MAAGKPEEPPPPQQQQQQPTPLRYQTWVLKVLIHCQGCKKKVETILRSIEGVYTTNIDSQQNKVTVTGDVDPQILIKKISRAGKHAEFWPENLHAGKEKKPGKSETGESSEEEDDGDEEQSNSPPENNNNGCDDEQVKAKFSPINGIASVGFAGVGEKENAQKSTAAQEHRSGGGGNNNNNNNKKKKKKKSKGKKEGGGSVGGPPVNGAAAGSVSDPGIKQVDDPTNQIPYDYCLPDYPPHAGCNYAAAQHTVCGAPAFYYYCYYAPSSSPQMQSTPLDSLSEENPNGCSIV